MQVKKKPKKTAKAVPEKSRKKKQPSEDQIKKQPFLKRMLFGEEKPDLSELEAGSTTILDILSPTTVDTKSRDYIIVDDVYHAYLYITGYGYTTTVGTCWLAPLVEAGEGIMDVLRLLCWCQNVRPDDLSSISTETERENLITLGLIKRHQRSDTLLLTNSGRAFLQAALEGDVPNLTLSYHDAAIERRVRLSSLMMTAYHAGINVFTITANSLAEPSTLFITAITRSRGHNPWGSARVGAIAHLGSTYYAVHYIYSGIGRMAVNDELAAFHNHTNFGKDTQRAFLFAGASYADIMEELKARDEKRDAKLIRYSEAYRGLHYPVHLLSCDETGARQLQIMAVPDYRVKISKLMLRSAYRPPPEDAPAWDATYQNRPFVIGADMNLRRIDAAIASAKKRGCLPISLAALDAQGDAVLLRRYKDTGYAVIYKVTESVLTELFGHPPSLYLPPCTQYLTKKGAVVDAPLIQVDRKDRGSPRK